MEFKEPFYVSHYYEELFQIMKKRSISKEFLEISNELKKELGFPIDKTVIMTGHQPILYYPGIFVKLILASEIAKQFNGEAYYLVLDTDRENVFWKFIFYKNSYYRKDLILNNPKEILLNQLLEENKKEQLLEFLKEWELQFYFIFEPNFVPEIKSKLKKIYQYISTSKKIKISELSIFLNEIFIKELNLKIRPIFLSNILNTKTYKYIYEFIKSNYKKFYKIYNTLLNDFRKEHHIQNTAIPFPNLKENELPFWKSNGYIRRTLLLEEDNNCLILPKAVIISLIIRGFLSDLMVHGVGGGFYDLVVERILNEFLGFSISPFITTTATVYPSYKASISFSFEEKEKILNQLRIWKFNPEYFINDECIFKKQKIFLIHLKKYYDSKIKNKETEFDLSILKDPKLNELFKDLKLKIEKDSNSYSQLIHKQLLKINHKIHLYSLDFKKNLEKKLIKSIEVKNNHKIFLDRTLPIVYYDIQKLFQEYITYFYNTKNNEIKNAEK